MEIPVLALTVSLLVIYAGYKLLDRLLRMPRVSDRKDRYIFITGCDTGFGNQIARRLDAAGCSVFAGCFTERGEVELTKASSPRLATVHIDVTDPTSVRAAYRFVRAKLPEGKGLWAILNNAGVTGIIGPVEWMTLTDYRKVSDVNLFGMIDVTQTFLPLVKLSRGRVVNTASILGRLSMAGTAPYNVSKYGVEAYSDNLRRQMRPFGVSVHLIEPGFFPTQMSNTEYITHAYMTAWNQASQDSQREYGQAYREECIKFINKFLNMIRAKDISGVMAAYEHALLGWWPRVRYVVGWDAKWLFLPMQQLPEFLSDFLLGLSFPVPSSCK